MIVFCDISHKSFRQKWQEMCSTKMTSPKKWNGFPPCLWMDWKDIASLCIKNLRALFLPLFKFYYRHTSNSLTQVFLTPIRSPKFEFYFEMTCVSKKGYTQYKIMHKNIIRANPAISQREHLLCKIVFNGLAFDSEAKIFRV